MLWKEQYRIGVESIDRQHRELFQITESLLEAVTQGAAEEVYEQSLAFLSRYVVEHFRDEEAYQESIAYSGLALHREEHRQFTQAVQSYVRRWQESGHDPAVMKNLSGMTMAWLIYHVISSDRSIVAHDVPATQPPHYDRCVEVLADGALDVPEIMAGLGVACDIRPPEVWEGLDCGHSGVGLHLDTPMGWLEIGVLMDDPRQQLLA